MFRIDGTQPDLVDGRSGLCSCRRCAFLRLVGEVDDDERTDGNNAERSQDSSDDREAESFSTDCPEKAAAIAASVPSLKRSASVVIVLIGS